ncbi:MAG: hypothetical protein AB7S38_17420 [Vulcanimicrobiota bacterium]
MPAVARLARAIARRRELERIEWVVYAVHCAKPNPKLRRVLEGLGFTIQPHPEFGEAFFLSEPVDTSAPSL